MNDRSLPHRVHRLRHQRAVIGGDGGIWYFAYGANLNLVHMRRHCPHAERVGRAWLPDHRLVFHGTADIAAAPGHRLAGGLWRLRKSDEAALDRFEGFPLHYRKDLLAVELEHQETVVAMLYRMSHGTPAAPRPAYLELLRQGYRDFDLPMDTLDAALAAARRPLLRR